MACEIRPVSLTFPIQGLYFINCMFSANPNPTTVMAMCMRMCTRVGLWVERRSGNS